MKRTNYHPCRVRSASLCQALAGRTFVLHSRLCQSVAARVAELTDTNEVPTGKIHQLISH